MDEYIRKEDVLDIASQYCTDDDGSCSKADVDSREMLDEIEALPAADLQPVKYGGGNMKIQYEEEIKKLITARNTLHRLENRGILENNLSAEQITAIRIAEFALDELCKSKEVNAFCRKCGARMDGESK